MYFYFSVCYWCYHGNTNTDDHVLVLIVEMFDYLLEQSATSDVCTSSFQELVTEFMEVGHILL